MVRLRASAPEETYLKWTLRIVRPFKVISYLAMAGLKERRYLIFYRKRWHNYKPSVCKYPPSSIEHSTKKVFKKKKKPKNMQIVVKVAELIPINCVRIPIYMKGNEIITSICRLTVHMRNISIIIYV